MSSKRRTHLTKLYKCLEPDCVKRFAQQQNLDRHIEREHRAVPTKYCHCTVDGCKYASTGEWRKSFLRADQAKEHIKEYGHYGPHSANVRPRRAENTLPPGHSITIYLEEWTALDEDRSSQHQRTIQSYEYDSSKTKLWHEDNTGDQFCREEFDGCLDGLSCQETDCYYHSCPPEGLERVFFKTEKGLQEHSRRAHEPPGDTASDLAPRQTIHYQIYESKQPDSTTGLENFNQTPWGSGIEYPNELDSYDQIFRAPDWTNEAFTHEPLDPAVSLDWGELFAAEPRVATAPQPAARELSSSFDCLPRSSNGKDQNLHLDVNIQDQTTVSTWNPIVSTFDFEMAYPLDSFISSPLLTTLFSPTLTTIFLSLPLPIQLQTLPHQFHRTSHSNASNVTAVNNHLLAPLIGNVTREMYTMIPNTAVPFQDVNGLAKEDFRGGIN
ncbi:uncharacterized protein PAC_11282 [Phialocephala subalpina]|uniref:C2H2-type domain-containing protein n=1 Tax=Phialocephala subalpina TaxID=576137 RepID=A0A1L7X8R7_9HELO|nr:uncharacterized protein PAC_11282 [Phialocephala subalpina]